jgi:hypothetical protein
MYKSIFLVLALLVFAGAGCATTTDNAGDATSETGGIITESAGDDGEVETSVTIPPAETE